MSCLCICFFSFQNGEILRKNFPFFILQEIEVLANVRNSELRESRQTVITNGEFEDAIYQAEQITNEL
jgi:hypothetical protein